MRRWLACTGIRLHNSHRRYGYMRLVLRFVLSKKFKARLWHGDVCKVPLLEQRGREHLLVAIIQRGLLQGLVSTAIILFTDCFPVLGIRAPFYMERRRGLVDSSNCCRQGRPLRLVHPLQLNKVPPERVAAIAHLSGRLLFAHMHKSHRGHLPVPYTGTPCRRRRRVR